MFLLVVNIIGRFFDRKARFVKPVKTLILVKHEAFIFQPHFPGIYFHYPWGYSGLIFQWFRSNGADDQ